MVRVPLILSWPGRLPENRRESALVNQIDIMPTLLRACGLEVPKGVEGKQLPLQPGDSRQSFVYSEYGAGEPEYEWKHAKSLGVPDRLGDYPVQSEKELQHLYMRERGGHLQMIRTHKHKLIHDSNGDIEFYDLAKDPHELENVHHRPAYRAEEAKLMALLNGRR
jgi:uncharacterized sulfatase